MLRNSSLLHDCGQEYVVNSVQELIKATSDRAVQTITIAQDLNDVPEIRLSPGMTLRGHRDRKPVLRFSGGDGVCLSSDNAVENISLLVEPHQLAVWNDDSVSSLGTLILRSVTTIGCVRLLARGAIQNGHIEVEGLDIVAADARSGKERPHQYGVYVLRGAFTLWNMQSDQNVLITSKVSGVGFVNFGTIDSLMVNAPIETHGLGARGFNIYTGTIRRGEFDHIVTHGDGAVGVQISQPVGRLMFRRGIETYGASGPSLVKGVLQNLAATALSIKPGGSAKEIQVLGGLGSHGTDVQPIEQHGSIESLRIEGGFSSEAGTSAKSGTAISES